MPDTAEAIRTSTPRTRARSDDALGAVLVLGAVAGLQTADPIISSVALVKASQSLHFGASLTALAASISTLALAATVIGSGLVADRVGRRRLLIVALGVTIVGDVITAGSGGALLYLLGRTVAGVGLGGVFGSAYAFVQEVAPKHVGAALGQFGATSGLTTMVAGLVGGSLASSSWRASYLVIPVLSIIGMVLVLRFLPSVKGQRGGSIDFVGLTLIAVGTIGVLYGISNAAAHPNLLTTWLPLLVGAIVLVCFVVVERRIAEPVLPVDLFRHPVFLGSVLVVLCWNLAQAVAVLQLSNLWQYILRYSPTAVSLGQIPFSLVGIASALVVGRQLRAGRSERSRNVLGLALAALGFAWFALARSDAGYLFFLPGLLLIGWGLPYAVVASGRLFMSEAPPGRFGPVTSSKTTIGQFGYALGLAGSMVLVSRITFLGVVHKLVEAGVPPSQTGQGIAAVSQFANTGHAPGGAVAHRALDAASGTYVTAFDATMAVVAIVVAAIAAAAWFLLGRSTDSPVDSALDSEGLDPVSASADQVPLRQDDRSSTL